MQRPIASRITSDVKKRFIVSTRDALFAPSVLCFYSVTFSDVTLIFSKLFDNAYLVNYQLKHDYAACSRNINIIGHDNLGVDLNGLLKTIKLI